MQATPAQPDAAQTFAAGEPTAIKRALISVSDKTGLAAFAQRLATLGVEIFSTGGTRRALLEAGVEAHDVSTYTGFPEMMDGRLKTLHPKIFGGILFRRDNPQDLNALEEHGISAFDLIVVNLYPFEQTIASPDTTLAEAIEQIDIGGPSLVRAAAKNHAFVAIATAPEQYDAIVADIASAGGVSNALRARLAAEAFACTAAYDQCIAAYLARQTSSQQTDAQNAYAENLTLRWKKRVDLRYGENPHQTAALYEDAAPAAGALVAAKQRNGKELSYNNYLDLNGAWTIARALPRAAAVVVKHSNPCGAASAASLAEATKHALAGDPLSAFGSVLGFNQKVDAATAELLCEPGLFIEAIVAPGFDAAALEMLTTRPKWKSNVRLMDLGPHAGRGAACEIRQIDGGLLVQSADASADAPAEWKVVTEKKPGDAELAELAFAWEIVRHIKSNAIAVCRDSALAGAGAGQMSRVDSVDIALAKAGEKSRGAVLSSDAFFPFPDSIHKAAEAGISAIIQPGGSKKDQQVIDACNERGLIMVFTGRRHFKH